MGVEFSRLQAGEWVVVLLAESCEGFSVQCRGETLEGALWEPLEEGRWKLRQPLSAAYLEEGTQSFLLLDAQGAVVASLPLIAGEPVAQDLVAQVDRLQAELDLLKRAFRDHCRQTTEG